MFIILQVYVMLAFLMLDKIIKMSSFANSGMQTLTPTPRKSQELQNQQIFTIDQQYKTLELSPERRHRKNKSLIARTRKIFEDELQFEKDAQKNKDKLVQLNFSHHNPDLCVCDSCNCGRHVCNLHTIKPDMAKYSIYRQSFSKKAPIPNIVNRSIQYDKLKGNHIGMDSIYNKSFEGAKGDAYERYKPEDLLKTGGPSPHLTSYTSGFPGYRGDNQYIKPKDHNVRADYPLRAKSTYANTYDNKGAPKPIKQKIQDNLKSNNLWLGRSTYGNFFSQPNPEDYAVKIKHVQKPDNIPRYARQYQTTYRNSFIVDQTEGEDKISPVCQSKKKLQSIAKGVFSLSKDRFAQNSDFKSLNPAFHSLSTSKHYHV